MKRSNQFALGVLALVLAAGLSTPAQAELPRPLDPRCVLEERTVLRPARTGSPSKSPRFRRELQERVVCEGEPVAEWRRSRRGLMTYRAKAIL